MNLGEVKLIIIVVLGLVLLGGGTYVGYHFTAQHYELLQQKENTASAQTLATAKQTIIDVTKERDALRDQEAIDHAARDKADAALRSSIDDRLRGLTAALRSSAVPGSVASTAGRSGTGAIPGGTGTVQPSGSELDAAFAEFNAASDLLIGAGQHDAREVTGILQVAPKVLSPLKGNP
jgi:hypothetical protein